MRYLPCASGLLGQAFPTPVRPAESFTPGIASNSGTRASALYAAGRSPCGSTGHFFSSLHSRGGHTPSPFFKGSSRITRLSSMVKAPRRAT
ncbi:hypothetical protein [Streptomyces sp. NPDC002265]|uniref:hypothetical protein n=1 Tax=Streptomyces sp. NPDC002265 TaxID=3154415 RepID=UPI003316C410